MNGINLMNCWVIVVSPSKNTMTQCIKQYRLLIKRESLHIYSISNFKELDGGALCIKIHTKQIYLNICKFKIINWSDIVKNDYLTPKKDSTLLHFETTKK